jgi:hypothetical protein
LSTPRSHGGYDPSNVIHMFQALLMPRPVGSPPGRRRGDETERRSPHPFPRPLLGVAVHPSRSIRTSPPAASCAPGTPPYNSTLPRAGPDSRRRASAATSTCRRRSPGCTRTTSGSTGRGRCGWRSTARASRWPDKTQLITPGGPWRGAEQVEIATLDYVDVQPSPAE